MKILIVDDNIAIQEILGEILTVDGYEIDKVGTVSEAIDKLDSFRPDALILDPQVGGESGLKVLDALPAESDVRAIILTRGKEVIPKDTAFIRGCIQKPFKSDDVTGRSKTYEAIVKGEPMPNPNIPESLNVLLHELRGLCLSVKLD